MTLFFNSLSSKALTDRLGVPPGYPPSIQAERGQRVPNPDLSQLSDLRKQLGKLDHAGQRNSPEYARANARWQALDSVLRPFRAEQVKPELSTTERNMAVDSKGKMRWIPGGSSFTISMDQPFQRGAEQAGRLVRSGTSGSAYYFHRYAQVMADRWGIQVDHRALRLAIIATFVGQGHHSLPEVLAGSAAFTENHGDQYPCGGTSRPCASRSASPLRTGTTTVPSSPCPNRSCAATSRATACSPTRSPRSTGAG